MGPDADSETKPFLDHLEDLRGTIIRSLVALAIGMALAFPLSPWLLGILQAPLVRLLDDPHPFLQSLEVTGAFTVALRTSLWAGLLLSAPFIIYFVGCFIFPGLKQQERKVVLRVGGAAVGLFFLGVLIGYFITLELALRLMYRFHAWMGIRPAWRVNDYVAFTTHLLIAFGIAFEMPVVLALLGKMGIINSRQLREKRRHVIVILFIVAMFLTPPDPFTQLAMALPLVALYEICIWVVVAGERRAAGSNFR